MLDKIQGNMNWKYWLSGLDMQIKYTEILQERGGGKYDA